MEVGHSQLQIVLNSFFLKRLRFLFIVGELYIAFVAAAKNR